MFQRLLFPVVVAVWLSGCAVHPLPENVTGVDTPHIVRQIRCEARAAVIHEVKTWLKYRATDPVSQQLLEKYEADEDSISEFSPRVFPASYVAERNIIKLFYTAGIAYTFDLKMAEFNDYNPTSVNLIRPSPPRPKFTLGLGAGALLDRSNERKFTITDTFESLLKLNSAKKQGRGYCTDEIVTENYVYPIAGKVGVAKVVHDFISLTLFGNLSGDKGAPPAMTDDLTFTTSVSASVNPAVVFTPLGAALQVSDAALTAAFKRSDVHEVVVGVAIDKIGASSLGPVRSYLFSNQRFANGLTQSVPVAGGAAGSLYIGNRVIGGGSNSERLAVIANDQAKSPQVQLVASP